MFRVVCVFRFVLGVVFEFAFVVIASLISMFVVVVVFGFMCGVCVCYCLV